MTILVTGGCGFIGSHFVLDWLSNTREEVWNIDSLTYAADRTICDIPDTPYIFVKGTICDIEVIREALTASQPRAIIHFAAETHVDQSITDPANFIKTNVLGTYSLLQASLDYWQHLPKNRKSSFKLINISTDEVYGSIKSGDLPFSESSQICPNSPYSASKASADHLVHSFHQTYGFPSITTRCTNNFGQRQHREKLIPKVIHSIQSSQKITVYGNGENIRDWIFVNDHIDAINCVLRLGTIGAVYNIGSNNELRNIDLIQMICGYFEEKQHLDEGEIFNSLVHFVNDRLGHDYRYAINAARIKVDLGWESAHDFKTALRQTIDEYVSAHKSHDFSR